MFSIKLLTLFKFQPFGRTTSNFKGANTVNSVFLVLISKGKDLPFRRGNSKTTLSMSIPFCLLMWRTASDEENLSAPIVVGGKRGFKSPHAAKILRSAAQVDT